MNLEQVSSFLFLHGFPMPLAEGIMLDILCRWFRFAQLAKGKKFRP